MTLNALLLLSSAQLPHPVEEIAWHADFCARTGRPSAVATTRLLTGLTLGRSVVAFYGDTKLGNHLLGYGAFAGYERAGTPRGDRLLGEVPLYAGGHRPAGVKGVVMLDAVQAARRGAEIEVLGGTVRATGLPLTRAHLPVGPARILVYFTREERQMAR